MCFIIKRWIYYDYSDKDESFIRDLAKATNITPLLARILINRGINKFEDAVSFLNPDKQDFFDPFLMCDMDKAVERIELAINNKQKIIIYGDYDVDGMTATALLTKNLISLGAIVDYYIPNRFVEGYGLNLIALNDIIKNGCELLVTVDCGISSIDIVESIKNELDIIITDHHIPSDVLPSAIAVLNPHRQDCKYPEKNLAGVGVAFKLCQALWRRIKQYNYNEDLDIVALGTIADIVPLVGENRKIVKAGLNNMREQPTLGLRILMRTAGIEPSSLGTGTVGFQISPRLNAAGRIDNAIIGVQLLLSDNEYEANEIAVNLNQLNSERQELERKILDSVIYELEIGELSPSELPALIVVGEEWNSGVIGIVASRLVDKYYRPAIVLTLQDSGMYKGSCRSIPGLNMYEALLACEETLVQFGGHAMAAGLSLEVNKLDDFRHKFYEYTKNILSDEDYIPKLNIDVELKPVDITFDLISDIALLEPFGIGNPRPIFGAKDLKCHSASSMGENGKHLRLELGNIKNRITGIWWNKGELAPIVAVERVDIAYYPTVNEWNGNLHIQCIVDYLQPAKEERIFPTREILVDIYKFLYKIKKKKGEIPYPDYTLAYKYTIEVSPISLYTMRLGIKIFKEIGLLKEIKLAINNEITYDKTTKYQLLEVANKLDLTASLTYSNYRNNRR